MIKKLIILFIIAFLLLIVQTNTYQYKINEVNPAAIRYDNVLSVSDVNEFSYATNKILSPNQWTAAWNFTAMENNSKPATEESIAIDLVQRGYNEIEIKQILSQGYAIRSAAASAYYNYVFTFVIIFILSIYLIKDR